MINRLRNYLIFLLVVFFLESCTAVKAVKLVNSGEAVDSNYIESVIPFSIKEHPMFLKARLNNSQKEYSFIFDTGAMTMIRQEVAKELGLPKGIEIDAADTGGNFKTIDLVTLDRIIVGDMEVRNCATGVADFSDIFSPNVAGILGSNFLRHFIVTIDYSKKVITISREIKNFKLQDDAIIMPFDTNMKNGFAPEIKCVVDGKIKGSAIIDTGFQGIAAIPLRIVKQTKAFIKGNALGAKGSMQGGMFDMSEENYALRIDELKVADLKLNNIPATSNHSKNARLLLGNKFLDKYIVTIDYLSKNMILVPYGRQFETNIPSYGVAFTKYNNKTIISGIWNNSIASKSGMNIGNEVTKVNSIEAKTLSLMDLMEICLDQKVNTIEIEFLNNGGKQKTSLHKEMLLPVLK